MDRGPSGADSRINQQIFETSLDLILVVSRQGEIIRVSPSSRTILGHAPEEMVGRSAKEFLYPDDLESTRNEMRAARRGRETRNFDCRYVHENGSVVPLAWTGVWSETEQQHFFIGRDMTERLAAEERQRRSQRLEAVGQLTGGIAHDFNNLLTVILGNLELSQRRVGTEQPLARWLRNAERAAQRGAELTAQLLAFGRRQALNAQVIDVNECVAETLGLLKRTLGEAVVIDTRLSSDAWPASADPSQLEAALVNLALNARDAMPAGGRLLFETANVVLDVQSGDAYADVAPGDYTMIAVSDKGIGMPPDVAARAFDPFFTTKAPGKGSGMGLSMVFGFAHQSKGGVKIYSELGHGTTVRLYLPRAEARAVPAVAQVPVEMETSGAGERILVVEDNPDVRSIVVEQLADLGYRVRAAGDAEAALACLRSDDSIDLLFTDVVMPGSMGGIELANAAVELRPGLKILFTSGFAPAALGHRAAADAAWPLLTKPYRKVELAAKLRRALKG